MAEAGRIRRIPKYVEDKLRRLRSRWKPPSASSQSQQPQVDESPFATSTDPSDAPRLAQTQTGMDNELVLCDTCKRVNWYCLPFEDEEGEPHHESLQALIDSMKTCNLCAFVFHAAVSNFRRSQERPPGSRPCWRRYETVCVPQDERGNNVRRAAYIKELGPAMPEFESDVVSGERGGYFTHMKFEWDTEMIYSRSVFVSVTGFTKAQDVEPVESAAVTLNELGAQIPKNMGIWLYGNHWNQPETSGNPIDGWYIMGIGARFGTSGHVFDSINNPRRDVHIRGSALSVSTDGAFPIPCMPRRFPEIDSSSSIAYERISHWIENGTKHHKCRGPPENPLLPTRVLDVSGSDESIPLYESLGARGKYIALSHRWGTSSRLTATVSNYEDLKRGIMVASLPKTFRDAVQITRRLGIRFLWIDCLCIIQNSVGGLDWEYEASRMGEYYYNSYITIAAANSTDSQTGCFPQRTDTPYVSSPSRSLGYNTTVHARGPNTLAKKIRLPNLYSNNDSNMYFFKEWLPGSCTQSPQMAMIGSFGQVLDPLEDEPLSSRGWTLQERLLPSRVVHYAKDQIYFQCDCTVQSEDGFKFPNKFFNLDLLIDTHLIPFKDHGVTEDSISFIPGHQPTPQNHGRWDGGWLSLIQNYSQRELTKRPDKLPALSGLARMLAKATGDRYLAGLWARHIPEDLFWRVYPWEESFEGETPVKGKLLGRVTRLEEYRAPSWSWASLDAPVRFLPLTYKSLVCRIISCSTTPSGVDEYGKVKAGKLVVEGPIYEIFPRARRDNEWATHGEPVEIRFLPGGNRGISLGHMYLDHRDEPLPPNFYALFLDSGNALVLRPRPSPSASQLDEPLRKVLERELDRMPEAILTTNDIIEQIQQRPETKTWVFQAVANAERIGLATFTNSGENKKKPRRDEPYPDLNGLRLEDIEMTQSGESWGMITAEDPKVRVTIL